MTDSDEKEDPRDKPLNVYVTQSMKDLLRAEADERGISLSAYVNQILRQARQQENAELLAAEENAEKRLLDIAAQAKDEFKHVADHTKDVQARSSVYSIALWELQKQQYPDIQRKRALVKAADRLHDRLGDHPGFQEEVDKILAETEIDPDDSDRDADADDGTGDSKPDTSDIDDIFRS